eukprot:scaffold128192_cov55-Attheya_sp.AAC.1
MATNTSNTAAGRAAGSTTGAAASNMGPAVARRTGIGAKQLIRERRERVGGKELRGRDEGKGARGRPPPQVRRPRQRRRLGEAALAEIRTMQKGTGLIIPKPTMMRLIREICQTSLGRKPGEDLRWTTPAIEA